MDDPLVQLAEEVNTQFSTATIPGKFLVDIFPLRQLSSFFVSCILIGLASVRRVPDWFPGTGFKAFAKEADKHGPYDATCGRNWGLLG